VRGAFDHLKLSNATKVCPTPRLCGEKPPPPPHPPVNRPHPAGIRGIEERYDGHEDAATKPDAKRLHPARRYKIIALAGMRCAVSDARMPLPSAPKDGGRTRNEGELAEILRLRVRPAWW